VSQADLATLSLLDPDQGICPSGHPCRLDDGEIGRRRCAGGEYRGMALICWDVSRIAIDRAAALGADAIASEWATAFLDERAGER
jgi:hypothetical protein